MFPLSKKLILASKSPRRQQLLADLGFEFEVRLKEVDEIFPDHIPLEDVAEYLAKLKAEAFSPTLEADECCITADTVVLSEGRIFGKALDVAEATEMLQLLSGKTHRVITGVCLITPAESHSFSVSTKVHFRTLEDSEIAYYIEQFQPFDKAGAYGIQEWIGMVGIEKIEGSYFNVVGLPTEKLFLELKNFLD